MKWLVKRLWLSCSGSGPGIKVPLCVGQNIDEGGVALLMDEEGGVALLMDEEGDSFNESLVGQGAICWAIIVLDMFCLTAPGD